MFEEAFAQSMRPQVVFACEGAADAWRERDFECAQAAHHHVIEFGHAVAALAKCFEQPRIRERRELE